MKPLVVGLAAPAVGTAGGAIFTPCAGFTGEGTGRRGRGTATGGESSLTTGATCTAASTAARGERRGPQQNGLELRPERLIQFLAVVHELHRRAAVRVANQIA